MLLCAHLEQALGIHAAGLSCHVHAHEGHGRARILIGGRRLHRRGLRAHEMCCRSCGIHEGCIPLHFLQHALIFLAGLHGGNAEGHDFQTAEIPPLAGKHLIQRIRHFHGMTGQCRITNAHVGDLREGGLQRGQKLCLQLAVQTIPRVVLTDVAADICIEENRIADPVAVLTEAADGDVNVDAGPLIHHPEGNR